MNKAILESAKRVLLALVVFFGVTGVGALGWFVLFVNQPGVRETQFAVRDRNDDLRHLDFKLFRHLADLHSQDSFIISPYAVRLGLMMLGAGAEQITRQEISELIEPGMPILNTVEVPELEVADRVWIQMGTEVLDSYVRTSHQFFGVPPGIANFKIDSEGSRRKINLWSSEKTSNLIDSLIASNVVDGLTRMILTSAVRARFTWQRAFHREQTEDLDFTVANGVRVKVPTMRTEGVFRFTEDDTTQVLELPFDGANVSMLIAIPRHSDGLKSIEDHLNRGVFEQWIGRLVDRNVVVLLPRFRVAKTLSLSLVLSQLGVTQAFNAMQADFSRIDGERDLFLNDVIHRTYLTVAENGDQGQEGPMVANEPIGSKATGAPTGRTVAFRVDKPFIFFIVHRKLNTVLVAGHVTDPRE